jgi:very-short-patch-repair endonuclease
VDHFLTRQAGVLTTAQALRHLSAKTVRHRVAAGRWQQPHRAILVTHNGPIDAEQRRWIAVLGIGHHAVLAGTTAAEAAGLRGFADPTVHILIPDGHRPDRVPSGVTVHRTAAWRDADVLWTGRPPRTQMARSIVDAAQWARTDDDAQALVAAAFQQRLTTEQEMCDVLERMTRARRRRLITRTVTDAAGGAHSLAEIDFGTLCRRHRLPAPSRQVVRDDAAGRRRYLDVLFDDWHVHVEIDGGQHLDVRQAWADMQRQNDVWTAGNRVLRFPAWAIRREPDAVAAQVRAALRAAGWRGTP